MRIAAISDVHGNLPALRAVLADIRRRGCDRLVNLGDIASGPLWPEETVDLLMQTPALTLRGNHERQLLAGGPGMGDSDRRAHAALRPDQFAWIASLPAEARLEPGVLLCHGAPGDDLAYLLERAAPGGARPATPDEIARALGDTDAELVLCGHSHVPRQARLADGRLCVNPGSVGLQAFRARHPCAHTMQSGTPAARYAMLRRERGAWHVDLFAVDYDPSPAVQLARERGCDEWADALRDGHLPG